MRGQKVVKPTPVVAILAHLSDKDAWPSPFVFQKLVSEALNTVDQVLLRVTGRVNPAHQAEVVAASQRIG